MAFVGGYPDEYCIFLKNLSETELAQITSLDGAPLDVKKELSDIKWGEHHEGAYHKPAPQAAKVYRCGLSDFA